MKKRLIAGINYDHPEHFDDEIRVYKTSEKYRPTPLEDLLHELAGYRCSLCNAPWLETHHIISIKKGGKTEYENLIILCPNCHTRVHKEGIPSPDQLKQCKLKQEIAYGLPILGRISPAEKEFLQRISRIPDDEKAAHSDQRHLIIQRDSQEEATREARKDIGLGYLEATGMISTSILHIVLLADGQGWDVSIEIRATAKGMSWLRYLQETGRLNTLL